MLSMPLSLARPPSYGTIHGMKLHAKPKFSTLSLTSLLFFFCLLLWLSVDDLWTYSKKTLGLDASRKKQYGASLLPHSTEAFLTDAAHADFPDFNRYIHVVTLHDDDVGLGRTII